MVIPTIDADVAILAMQRPWRLDYAACCARSLPRRRHPLCGIRLTPATASMRLHDARIHQCTLEERDGGSQCCRESTQQVKDTSEMHRHAKNKHEADSHNHDQHNHSAIPMRTNVDRPLEEADGAYPAKPHMPSAVPINSIILDQSEIGSTILCDQAQLLGKSTQLAALLVACALLRSLLRHRAHLLIDGRGILHLLCRHRAP